VSLATIPYALLECEPGTVGAAAVDAGNTRPHGGLSPSVRRFYNGTIRLPPLYHPLRIEELNKHSAVHLTFCLREVVGVLELSQARELIQPNVKLPLPPFTRGTLEGRAIGCGNRVEAIAVESPYRATGRNEIHGELYLDRGSGRGAKMIEQRRHMAASGIPILARICVARASWNGQAIRSSDHCCGMR